MLNPYNNNCMVKQHTTEKPEELDSEEEEMQKILGFHSFSSTKNKNHSETSVEYAAEFKQKRKFSVIMNRRGAYNRKAS